MEDDVLEDYFEALATSYVPVGHTTGTPRFARFNIEEVITGLRAKLDLPNFCLLLESPAGHFEDNGGDGFFEDQDIAFCIIKQCEKNDFEAEKEILSSSRKHARQVMAKVLKEERFIALDRNSIEYEKVGPVFANCFGYRFTFKASSIADLLVNPGLWSINGQE